MQTSFLKWAGGKRWFIKEYPGIFPKDFNRYIDPFLGGGSVFFYLEPKEAVLSDINKELIDSYNGIKYEPMQVYEKLKNHEKKHGDEYYYKVRKMKPTSLSGKSARFIYLNRTCFNGVYRVNRKGEFNTPKGSRNNVLFETDQFEKRSEILKNAEINCCDFETTINKAQEGDLLFCDPPYAIKDVQNFVNYTKDLFNWADQERLAQALIRAKDRGVKVICTNVDHPSIRALFKNEKGFMLNSVSRYCMLSAKGKKRTHQYPELIITANIHGARTYINNKKGR